jgi:hypothetical protein
MFLNWKEVQRNAGNPKSKVSSTWRLTLVLSFVHSFTQIRTAENERVTVDAEHVSHALQDHFQGW